MSTFAFGRNWKRFASNLSESQIDTACESMRDALQMRSLDGLTVLDVGCGSGVFSLAARLLGAVVTSFDADPESVECCRMLKRELRPDDSDWVIAQGSILDSSLTESLGTFDVVYAWGVLHHTGEMWTAMDRVGNLVRSRGRLLVSIYNDQGANSRRWRTLKRTYNLSPAPIRWCLVLGVGAWFEIKSLGANLRRVRMAVPLARYRSTDSRGMRGWFDLVDWVGGYPFEVARPHAVVAFYAEHGFEIERLSTVGRGHGCNEFLFTKSPVG